MTYQRAQFFGSSRGMRDPQVSVPFEEMDWMGENILAANAASLTLTLPYGVNLFEGYARVSGYSGSSIAGIRFNGDTGNNYGDRIQVSTSVTNINTSARSSIRVATVGITGPRGFIRFSVMKHRVNLSARVLGMTHSDQEGTTSPLLYEFTGTWNNTTALINSVTLDNGAAVNLLTGTYLCGYGARIIS